MKIIVLNDHAHVNGGAGAVALASARGLAQAGLPVTLFTAVGPVDNELADVAGLEVICLGQQEIALDPDRVRAFTQGLCNRSACQQLALLLDRHDPRDTIVHVHAWTKALSPFAIDTAIRRGFKVVLTLHDFFVGCPTGGLFLPKTAELCHREPLSWDCVRCSCDRRHYAHKLWRSARTFLQNRVLRIPDGIAHFIGVSEFTVSIMRPWLPSAAPITVVRNPVDCPPGPSVDVAANRPMLFVGRFAPEKGVLLAAEAVRRLKLPAVFVGDGEQMAQARALCPHATFTGWLPQAQVSEQIRRARALLMPSIWREPLGLVVVEAAGNGVPSIVSDQSAAAQFIREGSGGIEFSHGSADALCAALERLGDDALVTRLGRNAYDWYWREPWDSSQHIAALRAVYAGLLAQPVAA
jgi:glycosyltransferase involved in cell wall biosynthesis